MEKKQLGGAAALGSWSRGLSALEINRPRCNGRRRIDGGVKLTAVSDSTGHTQVRGFDVYISEEIRKVDGPGAITARKLLNERWAELADSDKQPYRAKAETENKVLDQIGGQNYSQFVNSGVASQLRHAVRKSMARKAAQRTLEEIKADPAWSNGAGLMGYGIGLKTELAVKDSQETVSATCAEAGEAAPL